MQAGNAVKKGCLACSIGADEAEKLGVPLLSQIPLHLDIRTAGDGGAPVVVSHASSPEAEAFRDLASRLVAEGHA